MDGLEHNAEGSLAERLVLFICIHRLHSSVQGIHVLHLCRLSHTPRDVCLQIPHIDRVICSSMYQAVTHTATPCNCATHVNKNPLDLSSPL